MNSLTGHMADGNQTSSNTFIIVGFSDLLQLQVPLFLGFLLIYLMTITGNLLIMIIVYSNAHLHTPMYFFLTNLSFLDITCTTIIFPKMLTHFFLGSVQISLNECLLQIYFFLAMLSTEFILLVVMAYDRYVAICNPLRYTTIMNKSVCFGLALGTWIIGFINPVGHTMLLSQLSFCSSRTINHFFCDVTALLSLSCSSTYIIEITSYVLGSVMGLVPFVLIVASYVKIISAIMKIPSKQGRSKAFSTCTSHLTVVILFYGSLSSTYMCPRSTYSMRDTKLMSLSYIAVTPLCNPIIYSLKNAEFKKVLKKTRREV